jgi:hypothetical protein
VDEAARGGKGRLVGDDGDVNLGKVESATNHMFMKGGDNSGMSASMSSDDVLNTVLPQREAPSSELWRVFQSSYSEQHEQIKALKDQMTAMKRQSQTAALLGVSELEAGVASPQTVRAKNQFAPRGAQEQTGGANPLLSSGAKAKSGLSMAALKKSPRAASRDE